MWKYLPGEVTLLVNKFRGFFGLYRLPVISECGIIHNKSTFPHYQVQELELMHASTQILCFKVVRMSLSLLE